MSIEAEAGAYEPFPDFTAWRVDFDSSVIDTYASRLADARSTATTEALERAVEIATRYAAVDTGAIEGLYTTNRGFTRTIAEQTANWEAALAQHEEHVKHSIEDALNGYDMVMDAVTDNTPITEAWIRQLHEVLCASQESHRVLTAAGWQDQQLPKGVYKAHPNNPTNSDTGRVHHYASPADTPAEMTRVVAQLRSPGFEAAHPVVQAAYAHYAFVCVHPFADGNGRVSRALASIFLYRRPGVPLVVFADQKDQYIDALEAADSGRPSAFVAFVNERAIEAVELVSLSLFRAASDVDTSLSHLRRDLEGRAGLRHADFDAINARLGGLLASRGSERLANMALPDGVTVTSASTGVAPRMTGAPEGYRAPVSVVTFNLRSDPPADSTVSPSMFVWSARSSHTGADFVLTHASVPPLEVRLTEIHPHETHLLDLKLDNWFEAVLSDAVAALSRHVHRMLVEKGYQPPE